MLPIVFVYGFNSISAWLLSAWLLLVLEFLNQYWTSVCLNLLFQVFWFYWGVSSVMYDRHLAKPYLSGSENVWVFGQLLQVFLLALPAVAAIEIITGMKEAMPPNTLFLTRSRLSARAKSTTLKAAHSWRAVLSNLLIDSVRFKHEVDSRFP